MTSKPRSAPREILRLRVVVRALGLAPALIGLLVLLGWWLDLAALKSIVPGLVTMKANTAAGILSCGVSLALLSAARIDRPTRYLVAAAALVAVALGASTLSEYLVGWDLGIDQMVLADTASTIRTSHPGRMSPISCLCFVLVGAALLTAAQTRFERLQQPIIAGLGASVAFIGGLALLGYWLDSGFSYQLWSYTGTAVHTAIGFVLLGAGLLVLVRSKGRLSWSLEPSSTAAVAAAMALMVLATGISYNVARNLHQIATQVDRTERLLAGLQRVATDMTTIESNQRGYVLTGDAELVELVARAKARVPGDTAALRELTTDDPDQHRRLDRLEPLVVQRIAFADRAIAAGMDQGFAAARQMVATGAGKAPMDRIGELLEAMQGEAQAALDRRQAEAETGSVAMLLLLPLGLFFSLTTMSLGMFLLNAGVEERSRAEQAASDSRARLGESEEQLRLAVDATQLGTWELDPGTGHRRWSDRSKALFGFPAAAEVTGEMISARTHPDDRPRVDAAVRRALQPDSGGELDIEIRLPGIEGREELWLQVRGRVLDDGGPARLTGTMLDITERKRAEEGLRASEGRYRTLFECAPDGILIADGESNYLSANASMCRMLGYSIDELIGMHASDIVRPTELEHIEPALDQIKAGTDYHREWQFLRKDGSLFPAEVIATMMPDGTLIGMVRDISERRQAEAALRGSEERFRTMANGIQQLAWIARADGYVVWYNQRWFEYTGAAPEQMEGWGWQTVHDPDALPEVLASWTVAIGAGEPFEMELALRGANGRFRTFLSRVQPLKDAEGHVLQWFGTHTDVEALKQVEERSHQINAELEQRVADRTVQLEAANAELRHGRADLKSLFESLPGLYLVLTPDLEIVAVSDAYLKATMTTRQGILGRNLFEMFPDNPNDPDATAVANLKASIDRVIRDGVPDTMAILKLDVRRPDGVFEERYWSPINSPMFGVDRQIKYIVHRVAEVTEFVQQKAQRPGDGAEPGARMQQMEAEIFQSSQKLQAANLQLEAANQELEAFSYSISHDLRAPLRGVDGYVRMLQEDCSHLLDPEGHRLLDVVSSEAKRMGRLIDDLLAFSRLSRVPMQRSAVDMNELARGVFDGLISPAPGSAPRFDLEPMTPAQGDLPLLRQVFVNLIGNAIKFSRHQSAPLIEVGCAEGKSAAGGAETIYHVKDNGAGFDEKYSHKLFGVFQRLHSEAEFEGTGVGLALVHRIIQRHSGRVWAEGKPGEGATFYFTVPHSEERSP
ncbi:MAG TPA: PAS domain S-box protein [Kofleriaceae bacterium]|nr:PAS domain S-box protein [Kofleriaceae bacterium]